MRRREFVGLVGGAAAWPLAARAQQAALPMVGFLRSASAASSEHLVNAFRQGLSEGGFDEGQNVVIEYRWADGQPSRVPGLAADLVRRKVAVIASTGGIPATLAARDATASIPIVFTIPDDPVKIGLVSSVARPDRNLTGINYLNSEIIAKRLELLHELVPTATRIAVLVNPRNPVNAEATVSGAQSAGRSLGMQITAFNASTSREIDAAFAAMVAGQSDAVFVGGDGLFNSRRLQLAVLAARHRLPTASTSRDYPASGGLMSYGADVTDALRQTGVYAGRILKGAKPSDLPVLQSTKIEFVINHQTARTLGIRVPDSLLARADEVIE
jgi:putative ABC transport system substrate-binding protein